MFHNSKSASDYIPLHSLKSCSFINVADDALAEFTPPIEGWANVQDCGEFPCTAPKNIVIRHTGTTFSGKNVPVNTDSTGTIVYALDEEPFYNCDYKESWNGW